MPTVKDGRTLRESDLYAPIRSYLAAQGYAVKGEVGACDLIATRGDEPPVIVELKTRINLELVLQAVDRLAVSESVYLAFPSTAPLWRRHYRRVRGLCRRLGVGIITLDGASLKVNVRLDPMPYRPRENKARRHRLLAEFEKRVGDPTAGGGTRRPVMTAYRQDALRCVAALADGPSALRQVRERSAVENAAGILQRNHYGWFERVRRGHYRLSPKGRLAAREHDRAIRALVSRDRPVHGENAPPP